MHELVNTPKPSSEHLFFFLSLAFIIIVNPFAWTETNNGLSAVCEKPYQPGEEMYLILDTVSAAPGETVTIKVELVPSSPVSSLTIDIGYDANKLIYTQADKTDTLVQPFVLADVNQLSPGTLRIAAAAVTAAPINSPGTLIKLNFQIKADATGQAEIKFISAKDDVAGAKTFDGLVVIVPKDQPTSTLSPEATPTPSVTPSPSKHFLSIGTLSASPGQSVTVPIDLTPGSPITSLTFDLSYDASKITFTQIDKAGTLIQSFILANANPLSPGVLRVAAAAVTAPPISNQGVLIKLIFRVSSDATGQCPLNFISTKDDLAGAQIQNGHIQITPDHQPSPTLTPTQLAVTPTPNPTPPAGKHVLSIDTISAIPGENVSIPINLVPVLPISSLTVDISYDSTKLTYTQADKTGTLVQPFVLADVNQLSPGTLRIAAAAVTAAPIRSPGVLIILNFNVKSDASGLASILFLTTKDDLAGAYTEKGGVLITPDLQPSPTSTPTLPAASTPTPTSTPSSGAVLLKSYEFDEESLEFMGWRNMPGGFVAGSPSGSVLTYQFIGSRIPSSKDKVGIGFVVNPGEVAFIYAADALLADAPVLMRMTLRADGPEAAVYFGALKGSLSTVEEIDGSTGYTNASNSKNLVSDEQTFITYFKPDTLGKFTPLIQVVGLNQKTTVYVDRVEIFKQDLQLSSPLQVYEFEQENINQMGWTEIPGGFGNAKPGTIQPYQYVGKRIPSSSDQVGISVTVQQGEVTFLHSDNSYELSTDDAGIMFRMVVRTDKPNASLYIVGLKGDLLKNEEVDGCLCLNNFAGSTSAQPNEKTIEVLFPFSLGGKVTPVIQIVGTGEATNVYIDRFEIIKISHF